MDIPEGLYKLQEADSSVKRRRALRNVLLALILCLSYLSGKFFWNQHHAGALRRKDGNYHVSN